MRKLIQILFASLIVISSIAYAGVPEGADELIRNDMGYPPKIEECGFEVEATDEGSWTYIVEIFDGAEYYLGTKIFNSLEKRFSRVPGIKKVKHEDRDMFLVRSKGLSQEQLRKALWEEFLKASAEAFPQSEKK
jgi:hypothetical protein